MAVRGKRGSMLAGRYRLLEQLGEGGMGSVWKAEHVLLHSHVAIKLIDPEVARLEFNLARFLREAKTLATLRSPNVVQVLDFGSDSDTPYLVMELLQGQTLGRRVAEQGRLSLSETSRILHDVCAAMSLVHEQGLIHRDLKPENIFLCNTGEQRVTKVVDFGIAKSLRGDMSASMKTRTGHMLGTPSYMSPEQCRGLKDIDHRADLWALGVIAYECLVGKVPFEGEVLGDLLLRICMDPLPIPSQKANGLPNAFDAWFAKAVARDRVVRFQSAVELGRALSELSTTVGLGVTLSPRELRELREAHEPRPTYSRPAAPASTPRHSSNTETNTTVGLGARAGRRSDRRLRLLVIAGVVTCAAAGLWAIGSRRDAGGAVNVDVQSLRTPYEVTPKLIRAGVPSGRRRQAAPAEAGAFAAEREPGGGEARNDEAPSPPAAAPPIDGVPAASDAPPAPGSNRTPPSSGSNTPAPVPVPSAAAPGIPPSGAPLPLLPPPTAPSGEAPATPGGSGTAPSTASGVAAQGGHPPSPPARALRGTSTPSAPNRSRSLQPSETGIRRSR